MDKHFGCVRFVYNYFLAQKIEQYRDNKTSDSYYKQAIFLTQLKRNDETIWLKEVNSQSLQFALKCLDDAYVNFFQGNAKFPKFKRKKGKTTFTIPQFAKIKDKRFFAPKFKEGIRINVHREVRGAIDKCTLSKTPTGKYFIAILSKEEYLPKQKTGIACGIDLGLKYLAVTSDGVKFQNNKYTKQYEEKLAKAKKHLSRKKKGSNSFEKQRRKIAKIYEKITNLRMDDLHKISSQLVTAYDIISLEDLYVRGMLKNHKLAKHISDVNWGTLVGLLEYKANWNNKKIVKINRFYPSSQTCCECGWINKDLNLSTRVWICKNGHLLDRDLNAAKNILREGLKILSSGTDDYSDGDNVENSNVQQSTKSDTISCGVPLIGSSQAIQLNTIQPCRSLKYHLSS